MKWNKYTIETTTEAEDYLSFTLMELGIEGIEIEDTDALIWKDLEDRIKQGMPGYHIELFDVEDFPGSIEMGCQVAEVINCYAKDGIEEVRTGQWCTLSEDTFVVVVAIKTTKQN